MTITLTGPTGAVAYWNAAQTLRKTAAFGRPRPAVLNDTCAFAKLRNLADNSNHAPAGADGAITADCGLGLLYRIAGTC